MPEEYITAEEARELMQVSRWKMAQLLKNGDIPYKDSPWDKRVKMIRRADVQAWMDLAGPRVKRKKEHAADGDKKGWPAPALAY